MAFDNKPTDNQQPTEKIGGLVERVTFHNGATGFCVLRLKVRGERDLVTLVGHTPSVTPGEYASASGIWVVNKEYGRQFKANFLKIHAPTTAQGIEKYLGSGMVKGIGPFFACHFIIKRGESPAGRFTCGRKQGKIIVNGRVQKAVLHAAGRAVPMRQNARPRADDFTP